MKQNIVVFIVAGFALTACFARSHPPGNGESPNDKLAEIQARGTLIVATGFIQQIHRTGLLKKLSIRYQGLDLTQEAAEFDISSLEQIP